MALKVSCSRNWRLAAWLGWRSSMQMLRRCFFALIILSLVISGIVGCGSSNRLQSISISPASATAQSGQAQFTATGAFSNSPMAPMPVAVDWFSIPPPFDPPSSPVPYMLTSQPFTAKCSGFSGPITVIALAPMDPGAPAEGTILLGTFSDLVLRHNTTQEGGFVAATAQMTCP